LGKDQTYWRNSLTPSSFTHHARVNKAVRTCHWCDKPAWYRSYDSAGKNIAACAQHKASLPRPSDEA
jgi:hypothetical protein